MKTAVVALLVVATVNVVHGQPVVRPGSARAARMGLEAAREQQLREQENRELLANGVRLFGEPTIDAPHLLPGYRTWEELEPGDWGIPPRLTVDEIVDDKEMVVRYGRGFDDVLLLRGLPTERVVDGDRFILPHPVVVGKPTSYFGRTMRLLEYDEDRLQELAKGDPREWTDNTGTFTILAWFVSYDRENQTVKLERYEDRETIGVPLTRLSGADQRFLRNLLREQQ